MACPETLSSAGADVEYDEDGTPPFTALGDVLSWDYNGITVEVNQDTALDAAAQFREKCPGFLDGTNFSFSLKFKKAKLTTLVDYAKARTILYWRFKVPPLPTESSPSYWAPQAFITQLGTAVPEDGGQVTVPVTIEVTGEPDFVEGTDS